VSTRPRRQPDEPRLSDLLTAGVREVPSVRYATACVGIAAAVALVLRSTPSAGVAVFGSTVMLAAMVLIALVSRVATAHDQRLHESLRRPAVALAWAVVGASIVVLALLITTTFWGEPRYYEAVRSQPHPTCYTETALGTSEPDAPTRSGNQTP
jgi:drug/metabolite transporter (DMT)-like permease